MALEQWDDAFIRRALALTLMDVIDANPQLGSDQLAAMRVVLQRLVDKTPLDIQQERALVAQLLKAGCELARPFEAERFASQWGLGN